MIKISSIPILLLIFITTVQSQFKPIFIEFHAGSNYDLNYTHKDINTIHSPEFGWSFGLTFEKMVSKTWSINIELNKVKSKSKVDNYYEYVYSSSLDTVSTKSGNVIINKTYNLFVVLAKKYFGKNKKFFLEFGWDIKQVHRNHGSWRYTSTEYYGDGSFLNPMKLDEPEIKTINSKYNQIGGYVGANIGIGTIIDISSRGHLMIKSRFSNQLKKAQENRGIIFRNIELLFGFKYNISKRQIEIGKHDL